MRERVDGVLVRVVVCFSVCVCVTMSAVDSGMEEQMVRAQSFFHRHKRENGSGSKRYPQLTIQLSISDSIVPDLLKVVGQLGMGMHPC